MTANDSEVKILEQIAKDLPSDAKGQISLYTEQQPCASCSLLDPYDPGVIQQFKNAYPGSSSSSPGALLPIPSEARHARMDRT